MSVKNTHRKKKNISTAISVGCALLVIATLALMFNAIKNAGYDAPLLNSTQDLQGSWSTRGGSPNMTAVIKDNTITIDPASGIQYWRGSFEEKNRAGNVITSYPNMQATLSTAKKKEFKYASGVIEFEFMAFGMSKTVTLHRE